MRVRFQVTVSSDDGSVAKAVNSELQLATGLDGVDPSIMKQDFLTQAESLVRTIAESQLPALYQSASDAYAAKKAEEAKEREKEAEEANRVAKARLRLRAMKKAKKDAEAANAAAAAEQEAGQETAHTDQTGVDVVECTDCGAKLESDMAHYVMVGEDGKFKRDAVLCDACYDKILEARRAQSGQPLEANDGGTRQETGENGEAAE